MTPTLPSLQYNVSQLLKCEVGSTREYDFEADSPLDLDDSVAHDIRGHVRFVLTNFGIVAGVQARAVLDLNCARCVEPFELPVDISFEDEYQPLIDIATGLPSVAPRSDAAFSISQNHTVDLGEAIRQHLLLSVELIPLCSSDCKGLCPICGVNRNQQTCTCPPAEEPSPFAVLQGLFGGSEADH